VEPSYGDRQIALTQYQWCASGNAKTEMSSVAAWQPSSLSQPEAANQKTAFPDFDIQFCSLTKNEEIIGDVGKVRERSAKPE